MYSENPEMFFSLNNLSVGWLLTDFIASASAITILTVRTVHFALLVIISLNNVNMLEQLT